MRRGKADYSGLALPKPGVRVRDEAAMDEARDRGRCEKCGVACRPHPHHVKSRGAGGGDTRENLISLCPPCHDLTHRGLISRDTLRAIVAARS
jgi:5-methylcytosine-specific restriction endonuclease McrA